MSNKFIEILLWAEQKFKAPALLSKSKKEFQNIRKLLELLKEKSVDINCLPDIHSLGKLFIFHVASIQDYLDKNRVFIEAKTIFPFPLYYNILVYDVKKLSNTISKLSKNNSSVYLPKGFSLSFPSIPIMKKTFYIQLARELSLNPFISLHEYSQKTGQPYSTIKKAFFILSRSLFKKPKCFFSKPEIDEHIQLLVFTTDKTLVYSDYAQKSIELASFIFNQSLLYIYFLIIERRLVSQIKSSFSSPNTTILDQYTLNTSSIYE